MACKDTDGNYISVDAAVELGEYVQEIIPEERVCSLHVLICFFFH